MHFFVLGYKVLTTLILQKKKESPSIPILGERYLLSR